MKKLLVLAAFLSAVLPASAASPRILAAQDQWPVWSPDGSKIAFTRVLADGMALEVLDLRTQRVQRIAENSYQLLPSWSPDGRVLLFQRHGRIYLFDTVRHQLDDSLGPGLSPFLDVDCNCVGELRHGDLYSGDIILAKRVIGQPAADSSEPFTRVVFQRDDGVYIVSDSSELRLASIANPGPPAWSHDGKQVAFVAGSSLYVVDAHASTLPRRVTDSGIHATGKPAWSFDDSRIAVPSSKGIWVVEGGAGRGRLLPAGGLGVSWAPHSFFVVASGPRPACPGHVVLQRSGLAGPGRTLTGSCVVAGTPHADVIEGTPLQGDVIQGLAGNDQIHANDGHTDRVDCGPGRDTVWADRTDRLTGCEIAHR